MFQEGAHSDALFRTSSTLQKLLALARGSSHQPRSPAQLDPVDVDSDSVDLALAIPIYYAGLDLLAQVWQNACNGLEWGLHSCWEHGGRPWSSTFRRDLRGFLDACLTSASMT